MKKILNLFIFVVIFSAAASAQNFDGNNVDVGVGIGLGSTFSNGFAIPIFAQADFGIADKISVGGTVGFASSKDNYVFGDYRYTYILFGARGNYHWGKHLSALPDKLDLYAGLTLGYYIVSIKYPDGVLTGGDAANSIWLGGQVGGRWFFKENMAAFAEVGAGIGYLKIGIDFRLK